VHARAKAMLLRKADVGPGFKASKPSDDEFDFEKENEARYLAVSSGSEVYETKTQSAESWRRGTSVAGMKCMEAGFRKLAKAFTTELGVRTTLASFKRVSVPPLAPATASYRVVFRMAEISMIMDSIVMRNGRAQAWTLVFATPSAYPRAEQLRLSRIVAGRMAQAMRGE